MGRWGDFGLDVAAAVTPLAGQPCDHGCYQEGCYQSMRRKEGGMGKDSGSGLRGSLLKILFNDEVMPAFAEFGVGGFERPQIAIGKDERDEAVLAVVG